MEYSFTLDDQFVEQYRHKKAPFGFNGLGETIYRRTYSRTINGRKEEWFETVRRVVEGTYSIQKNHIEQFHLGWNDEQGQRSAQEMYDLIFNMKFLPPGRGLYCMGTPIVFLFLRSSHTVDPPEEPRCSPQQLRLRLYREHRQGSRQAF